MDPVTAQGIRDALRFGRLLAEAAAPVLGDPQALDRTLRRWERRRDRECLDAYQWTNLLARAEAMNPIEAELYRLAAGDRELGTTFLDVFSRTARPAELLSTRRLAGLTVRALAREGADRDEVARIVWREARIGLADGWRRHRLRLGGPLVRGRVTVVESQRVAAGVQEERPTADARVHDVASELNAR